MKRTVVGAQFIASKKRFADGTAQPRKSGLTAAEARTFQAEIYRHYRERARKFPWRETKNPYHILVSELMLQQTQTERVTGKYDQFIKTFPNFNALANAPLRKILKVWHGLGYNRRALALKEIARSVMSEFRGELPSDVDVLVTLPGIGKATASAIAAFAFNQPSAFIETNIRRVFIHFFFKDRQNVKDSQILPFVATTLDTSNPREWYYALMDYGVMLKENRPNPNRRSAHYRRQDSFEGSNRQVRGMILRALVQKPNITASELVKRIGVEQKRMKIALLQLKKEGFIKSNGRRFVLV